MTPPMNPDLSHEMECSSEALEAMKAALWDMGIPCLLASGSMPGMEFLRAYPDGPKVIHGFPSDQEFSDHPWWTLDRKPWSIGNGAHPALTRGDFIDIATVFTHVDVVSESATFAALTRLALSGGQNLRSLAHQHPLYPNTPEALRVHSAFLHLSS